MKYFSPRGSSACPIRAPNSTQQEGRCATKNAPGPETDEYHDGSNALVKAHVHATFLLRIAQSSTGVMRTMKTAMS